MIRVYNGDACAVQESEYDWRTALRFFLNGHRDEYILIYRDDKPIKTLSYRDICYNREVPEKIIYLDQDVFAEARKYFFTYREQEERWMRAVAVCNRQEEVECILYYQHNPITTGHPVSEFEEYDSFPGQIPISSKNMKNMRRLSMMLWNVVSRRRRNIFWMRTRRYFWDRRAAVRGTAIFMCCRARASG